MKKINYFFKSNLIFDSLIVIFLSHIFYRITFVNSLEKDFSLVNQIRSGSVISESFFVESPTFTLICLVFGIENFDIYKILVYFITLISLFLIVVNIQHLEHYSTFFLFSGWLVSCSWFVGFVDVISVLLMVLISKNILKEKVNLMKIGTYFLFLSLNHNAISIGVTLIYLILSKKENVIKVASVIIPTQLIGNLLINYYLNIIKFPGRGRFRFVFNDNVIEIASSFVGSNLILVFWSGFLGTSLIFILIFNMLTWQEIRKILSSILIALFFTSIALDTSRVFSLLVVPIIIYSLNIFNNDINFINKLPISYTFSFLLFVVVGVYHFFGIIYTTSPMNEVESFYDFIPRIINSLMSNIWK